MADPAANGSSPSPPNESSSSGELRTKNKMLHDAEAMMKSLKIGKADPIMAPNAAPGTAGRPIKIQTNAFGIGIKKSQEIFMYDIRIHADLSNGKEVEFTKKGKDDHLVNDRRLKSVKIMKTSFSMNPNVFGSDPFSVWYDGQSLLFSATDILQGKAFLNLIVPGKATTIADLEGLECIIDIKALEGKSIPFSAESMLKGTASPDLSKNNRQLTQFVEIVLNQAAIMNPERHHTYENGKTFMVKPWDEGFGERDCPNVTDGKRLMPGSQKSVRQIEGPRGRGLNNPCLIIDAKKAAFHEDISVIDKANKICGESFQRPVQDKNLEKLNGVMRGLFVSPTYTKRTKSFQITAVAKHTANSAFFELDGGEKISVKDYYLKKYEIVLKYPEAPLLVTKERGKVNQYPMELCKVNAMQRVTIPQQTPEQSALSTKNCAVNPSTRQLNTMKGAKALEVLNEKNPYVVNAGIQVFPTPILVNARIMNEPTIVYGSGSANADAGRWKTAKGKFVVPANVGVWGVYAINSGQYQMDEGNLRGFAERLYKECMARGMVIKPPSEIKIINEGEVREKLRMAAVHNCKFCFFISSDTITSLHSNLKLWEREFQVITQDMKMSNAKKVILENKWQTMENVVLKTNVKLGGVNYVLNLKAMGPGADNWLHPGRLVLGVGLSHPPPAAVFEKGELAPTVLGFSANMKENPLDYTGDFIFQETRREEMMPSMQNVVEVAVSRYMDSHGGKAPSELIIYRSGIAEGSFSAVLSHEIPLIRAMLASKGDIKLVFIVAQKEHNVRLFLDKIDPREKPTAQNIRSGSVVDEQLTHPSFKEFYLNSHITLQGSARTPRYTCLVDDLTMSMDEIEGVTYALAHNHQIVSLTTSLPAPLYIANRYAERGRALLGAHILAGNDSSSSDSSHDLERLSGKLCYKGTRMEKFRVNA